MPGLDPVSGLPETGYTFRMDILKVGPKGQVTIPSTIMRRWGLTGASAVTAEVTNDGALIMRPAGVYPLEIYSDERIAEFMEEDQMTPQETRRLRQRTKRR